MFNSFLSALIFGVIILNMVSAATVAVFPAFGEVIGGKEYVGFLLPTSNRQSLRRTYLSLFEARKIPIRKTFCYRLYLCRHIMGTCRHYAVRMADIITVCIILDTCRRVKYRYFYHITKNHTKAYDGPNIYCGNKHFGNSCTNRTFAWRKSGCLDWQYSCCCNQRFNGALYCHYLVDPSKHKKNPCNGTFERK